MIYHVNPTSLSVSRCTAVQKACPFSDGNSHFDSQELAQAEAERRLEAEHPTGAGRKREMVESFEEWQVNRLGKRAAEELPPVAASAAAYKELFEPENAHIAVYLHLKRLNLEEAGEVAAYLAAHPEAQGTNPDTLAKNILAQRVAVTEAQVEEVDERLKAAHFFSNPRFQTVNGKLFMETAVTFGEQDILTRMDETGKTTFGIYDHDSGETFRAVRPSGFVDDNGLSASWDQWYEHSKELIHFRILRQKELNSRKARAQLFQD